MSQSADEKRLADQDAQFLAYTRKRLAAQRAASPLNEDTAEELLLRLVDARDDRIAALTKERDEAREIVEAVRRWSKVDGQGGDYILVDRLEEYDERVRALSPPGAGEDTT